MTIEEREWQDIVDMYLEIVCKGTYESIPVVSRLIEIGHIRKQTIIHFMALQMYPDALAENKSQMAAMTDIAVKLNVSERTIWSIIQNQKR